MFAWLSLDEDDNDPALAAVLAIVWASAEITGGLDLILDRLGRNESKRKNVLYIDVVRISVRTYQQSYQ
jgi:predicted transcriptional regulator